MAAEKDNTTTTTARPKGARTALLGAMFLMATSAIGPGFITQTSQFTMQLGAAFAFAILVSLIVDFAVQMNVWRVLGISGRRANALANDVRPGLGWVLAALVVFGGLVFNIGNIAGTGMGMQYMTSLVDFIPSEGTAYGLDPRIGAVISVAVAMVVFLVKRAGAALDRLVVVLGALMILLMLWVAFTTNPPVGEALRQSVFPETTEWVVVTTLIGGTVGGYITYAGAHRLVDAGQTGPEHADTITRSSMTGIIVTGVMRVLLFLAILGTVMAGAELSEKNAAADAFGFALGDLGVTVFGIILWAAAITSVVGASYTSISFITSSETPDRTRNLMTVGFAALCLLLYLVLGKAPATLLVFAGALNGLILPLGFTIILWVAWRRRDLLKGYVYPKWLLISGLLAWVLTLWLGYQSLGGLAELWNG